jgi:hypothetical protein
MTTVFLATSQIAQIFISGLCFIYQFYSILGQAVTLEILLSVLYFFILLDVQQLKKTFIKEHCNGHLLCVCMCKYMYVCVN